MLKKKKSIYGQFLIMTILPMLLVGIVITIASYQAYSKAMYGEIEGELENLAGTVKTSYDLLYPGDYEKVEEKNQVAIIKGEKVISTQTELIDSIYEQSGVHVSIFYRNTRIATTICDNDGERCIGTVANSVVEEEVLRNQKAAFYDNAKLNGITYFAYYVPLFNSDNTCVGMISVAKTSKSAKHEVYKIAIPIFVFALISMAIAGLISLYYSKQMIRLLETLRGYLAKVARGKLDEDMDTSIIAREDEIGEMGRSINDMRISLKEMVEIDTLTGINNRRCGEKKIAETMRYVKESGVPFAIAMGDIDYFKKVNDTYGHEAGDEVLKAVARLLKRTMVGKGYAIRWGGEEFLLVFDRVDFNVGLKALEAALEELRNSVVYYKEEEIHVTMTLGIVEGRADLEMKEQIKVADDKLYFGKMGGRNRIVM